VKLEDEIGQVPRGVPKCERDELFQNAMKHGEACAACPGGGQCRRAGRVPFGATYFVVLPGMLTPGAVGSVTRVTALK
jgi:uncharacterized protein (DUF983 family)